MSLLKCCFSLALVYSSIPVVISTLYFQILIRFLFFFFFILAFSLCLSLHGRCFINFINEIRPDQKISQIWSYPYSGMPSAGYLVYLLVGLNSLIQWITIHVEALLSLCVGQFSHVLSLPVCRCYSFIEPLQNCFSCNLLLPVGHSKNPEKWSLRFRTPEWPERYNWACSVGWPDLDNTYSLNGGI